MKKQKCLSLGPKLPDLGTFGLKFEGSIVIFEISTFEFVCLQTFAEKQKCLNLRPKMPFFAGGGWGGCVFWAKMLYLDNFGLEFQRSQICQNESLTRTVHVSIESAFSEGLGPNPVYKVCLK